MATHLSKREEGPQVRTFLAVELPQEEKTRLAALERGFAGHLSVLKWVAPDLLHITVRFLGALGESRLGLVADAAAKSAANIEPFTLRMTGLGAFPSERSPRVLWVELAHDRGFESLSRLFERLEGELAGLGFPKDERAFSPHITLGRVRDTASSADRQAVGETLARVKAGRNVNGHFAVRQLVVMRSDLARSGPKYTPIAFATLGRADGE